MAGQDLTCWGLPSLRRAVADQWNMMIPPTLEENPQRPSLRQSSRDLTSPGRKPGRVIWRPSAAQTTGTPSRPHRRGTGERRALRLEPAWLQELPEGSQG